MDKLWCIHAMDHISEKEKKKHSADTNNWTTDIVEYHKNARQNLESTKNILFDSINIKM